MKNKANNPKAIDPFFKITPKINSAQPDKINSILLKILIIYTSPYNQRMH